MTTTQCNFCNPGCVCTCHHNHESLSQSLDCHSERKSKGIENKLFTPNARRTYETTNMSLTSSWNGMTDTFQSSAHQMRTQSFSPKPNLRHGRNEEEKSGYEQRERYVEENVKNNDNFKGKNKSNSMHYMSEHQSITQDQINGMLYEIDDLRWENENLTFKLEQANREKCSANAMSNSLQRILADYSSKTKLKSGDEPFMNQLMNENQELKDIATIYQILMDHTMNFMKHVSMNERVEMRDLGYYMKNDEMYSVLLDRFYQNIYGKRSMKMNDINEDQENEQQHHRYNSNEMEVTLRPDCIEEINENRDEERKEGMNDIDNEIFNKIPIKESDIISSTPLKQDKNSQHLSKLNEKINSDVIAEDNKAISSSTLMRKNQLKGYNMNAKEEEANVQSQAEDEFDPIKEKIKNILLRQSLGKEGKEERSSVSPLKKTVLNSPSVYGRECKRQILGESLLAKQGIRKNDMSSSIRSAQKNQGDLRDSTSSNLKGGKSVKNLRDSKEFKDGQEQDFKGSKDLRENVKRDSKEIEEINPNLYKKKKPMLQYNNQNCCGSSNGMSANNTYGSTNAFNRYGHYVLKNGKTLAEHQDTLTVYNSRAHSPCQSPPRFSKSSEESPQKRPSKSNQEASEQVNEHPDENNKNDEAEENTNQCPNTYHDHHRTCSPKRKDKFGNPYPYFNKYHNHQHHHHLDKAEKFNSSLHCKSQSMTNIHTEKNYQTISNTPIKMTISAKNKVKVKKAATNNYPSKRATSPFKQERCTACQVDCNVSSTGYSPMNFSPFTSRVRRRSITPAKSVHS